MTAIAIHFFNKAKKMDDSITLFLWALNSKCVKIKDARSIPEQQMGFLNTFFHQAPWKVAGGLVYMQV